jgi:hypothetical protein
MGGVFDALAIAVPRIAVSGERLVKLFIRVRGAHAAIYHSEMVSKVLTQPKEV